MNSRKRIFAFAVLLIFIGAGLLTASAVLAAGLVPCGGGPDEPACDACHFFVLARNILELVLKKLVPAVAVLFVIYGGFTLLTAGGSPERVKSGRKILFNTVIGLAIAYGAFVIVGTVLGALSKQAGGYFNFNRGRIVIQCEAPPAPKRPKPTETGVINACEQCSAYQNRVVGKGYQWESDVQCEGNYVRANIPLNNTSRTCPFVAKGIEVKLAALRVANSGWVISEAFPPTVRHASPNHYNGRAVDITLRPAIPPDPGNITASHIQQLDNLCRAAVAAGFNKVLNEYWQIPENLWGSFRFCPPPTRFGFTTSPHLHLE